MNLQSYLIIAGVIVYIIQLAIIAREVSEGEYTRKSRVLVDLVPFIFLFFAFREMCAFLYELCFEDMVDEFKKLKW